MTDANASLTAAPPSLTASAASRLAAEAFGLFGTLTRLTSERDLNFRIEAPEGDHVLKVANAQEPHEVTRFQTAALLHLEAQAPDLPVPRVRRTLQGATEFLLPGGEMVRALTYLQGQPMHAAPRPPAQRVAMGRMAAQLTKGLQGFSHPAASHRLQWDIRHAADLRPMLPHVADAGLRSLATATLDRFEAEVAPRLNDCRWQVVHNDLNPHNLLVDPADPARIAGVLDFGDMVETPLVCDLGVAASYQIDPEDAAASLAAFTAAYDAVLPLTDTERTLVGDLTQTRMLTTLAIASWRASLYPENAPYILRNLPSAAAGLTALAAVPPEKLTETIARACGRT